MTRKFFLGGFPALALGAALVAGAVPAAAQGMQQGRMGGYGPGPMAFGGLDADGDGKVTLEEYRAAAEARFAAMDADGDGALGSDELGMGRGWDRDDDDDDDDDDRRRRADDRRGGFGAGYGYGCGFGPGDGHEFGHWHGHGYGFGPGFGCGDDHGYGHMGPMMGHMGPMMHGFPYGGWQGGPFWEEGRGEGPRGGMSEDRAEAMIEMRDQNGDGLLSAEELTAAPGRGWLFDRMDADGDGAISKEEFEAARDAFGPMRGRAGRP
ncbi:EF-hand domain-containing protein [Actibacterium sp. MT2.3-13A]|uniref:EF-hand domain-containing protein n=1 Tax=Actibacterium sp. MT2.3-13A TaxID=2828332 RepID=UPI001BA6DF49|nr:EF-hand domain-containing protein [Actibacterium sp. MT2.3-13A]